MTLHLSLRERSSKGRNVSGSKLKAFSFALLALVITLSVACKIDERQSGIPSKAQEAINSFTEDFSAGRFDKIYNEAAGEWRARVTFEQSNETFRTLKERLGTIKERTFTSGKQQQNPSSELPGNSLVVRYNTKFKRPDGTETDGMETFTLIERDGRYLLAGYSVSSDALKQ